MDETTKQNILKDLGLEALPKEEQEEALMRVGKVVFQGVLIRVAELLDDKQQAELEKLLASEAGNEEALFGFLRANVPSFGDIVTSEVARFREESRKVMGEVGK